MSESAREQEIRTITLGRELISRWMGLFKSLRLYTWQHSAVEAGAERVRSAMEKISDGAGDVKVTVRGDSVFIDSARVREGGASASSYQAFVTLFNSAGIDTITVDPDAPPLELQLCSHLLLKLSSSEMSSDEVMRELQVRGGTGISIQFGQAEDKPAHELEGKDLQKRIYLNSIGVLKSVFHETRAKDRISSRRVKRVVQQLMESIESDAEYMLQLTSVKNYDEYTFNHSVNVGVLAIALGRSVGLSRRQLYVVGQAGMLHDLGKLCVPKGVLNKEGRLTPEERVLVQSHPDEGFLSIATKQGINRDSISVALGAYEHHLNVDGSGYPTPASARPIGLLSRIVAIVDRYDAMTSARIYRSEPIPPPKALAIMNTSQRNLIDQTLFRYFLNMVGAFPLGTTVRLSDNSVAIVVGAASREDLRHLPMVRLVLDSMGRPAEDETVDLAARAKDPDPLFVIETLNPVDYGIEAMDYIL